MLRCKRHTDQHLAQPACVVAENCRLKSGQDAFPSHQHPFADHHPFEDIPSKVSVLLWHHNQTLPRRNHNCLVRWPGMTKHLNNPTLQVYFLLALSPYVTVVCTFAWISFPLFELSTMPDNTVYPTAWISLGKCFYSSGKHPSTCCASTTAHEGGKFTGEFMLNNSCPFPFVGEGVLVASISEGKLSLIQLCKTDIQHQDFSTSCAKLL